MYVFEKKLLSMEELWKTCRKYSPYARLLPINNGKASLWGRVEVMVCKKYLFKAISLRKTYRRTSLYLRSIKILISYSYELEGVPLGNPIKDLQKKFYIKHGMLIKSLSL